jgi:hypothetical protein
MATAYENPQQIPVTALDQAAQAAGTAAPSHPADNQYQHQTGAQTHGNFQQYPSELAQQYAVASNENGTQNYFDGGASGQPVHSFYGQPQKPLPLELSYHGSRPGSTSNENNPYQPQAAFQPQQSTNSVSRINASPSYAGGIPDNRLHGASEGYQQTVYDNRLYTNDEALNDAQQSASRPNSVQTHDQPGGNGQHQRLMQNIQPAAPPQPLQLPPGWAAYWNPDQGKHYYHNTALGQTTWDLRK